MAHSFDVRKEIQFNATPDEIWEAIATGAGIDGWFLGGSNEVEPREGGRVVVDVGDERAEATVTAWDPPHRFAYRGEVAPDGSLHAFEYTIEARSGGSAIVRLVHSGFLSDADWESEYDALNEGDFMYLHLMAQYVTHFRGRRATVLSVWRSDDSGRERAVRIFRSSLGVSGTVAEGTPVHATPDGLPAIDGVVDLVSPSILGIRTADALYRFLHSPQGVVFLGHHIYRDDLDRSATEAAWRSWLDRAFAQT